MRRRRRRRRGQASGQGGVASALLLLQDAEELVCVLAGLDPDEQRDGHVRLAAVHSGVGDAHHHHIVLSHPGHRQRGLQQDVEQDVSCRGQQSTAQYQWPQLKPLHLTSLASWDSSWSWRHQLHESSVCQCVWHVPRLVSARTISCVFFCSVNLRCRVPTPFSLNSDSFL